jgi:hypothetical protein
MQKIYHFTDIAEYSNSHYFLQWILSLGVYLLAVFDV